MPIDQPTVFIIDDDAGVRGSLQALAISAGLAVEVFDSASAFFRSVEPGRRGCAVVDLCLGDDSGLTIQDQLKRSGSHMPFIMITGHGTVPDSVRAFRGGALDFLQKPFSPQLLLERIHVALELDRSLHESKQRQQTVAERLARLTPRERQVMELLETGRTSKDVALVMDLSVRTVEGYRREVLRKLEVGSVAQMVRLLVADSSSGNLSKSNQGG